MGATLHCGAWASPCGGFSCCGAQALCAWASVVAACGLWSKGSVVVAHGLSCSATCGIFEAMPPALAGRFLATAPPGKASGRLQAGVMRPLT